MSACTAAVAAAMSVATWAGLSTLAPPGAAWPRAGTIPTLAVHLTVVTWCFGALALAVAVRARRRGTALSSVAFTAVLLYLIDYVARSWTPARPFG